MSKKHKLKLTFEDWLFFSLIAAFLFVRLIALEDFPIYFFCDEAFIGNQIDQLLKNNLKDAYGNFLPLFFEKAPHRWVPQLSIYIYMLPVLLFGKSILVLRATTAVLSVIAPVSLAIMAKYVFKLKNWWVVAGVISLIPTFLLHSRTAFETALVIVCYAGFIASYLMYRIQYPKAIFLNVIFGACCAYLHFSGTITILAALSILIVIDLPHHIKNRRIVLLAMLLSLVLALPLLMLLFSRWDVITEQLRMVFSPWQDNRNSNLDAGLSSLDNFLAGFSFSYWFVPEAAGEISRHLWNGRAHISQVFFPFYLLGLISILLNIRKPEARVILISLVASLAPLFLVDRGIMRIFSFVIPASMLITIGLDRLMRIASFLFHQRIVAICISALLFIQHGILLKEAKFEAPLWYQDYGLYGMQYGAKQLFKELTHRLLLRYPNQNIFLPVSWANGAEEFFGFFFTPAERQYIQGGTVEYFMTQNVEHLSDYIVIMTPNEFENAKAFAGFSNIDIQETLNWPNGEIGFYVTRLSYSENFPKVLAQKEAELRQIVEEQQQTICGSTEIRYSAVDMGTATEIFDGDPRTLIRGAAADPYILSLNFAEPCRISKILMDLGASDYIFDIDVTDSLGKSSKLTAVGIEGSLDMWFSIQIPPTLEMIKSISISIDDLHTEGKSNIHIREIKIEKSE